MYFFNLSVAGYLEGSLRLGLRDGVDADGASSLRWEGGEGVWDWNCFCGEVEWSASWRWRVGPQGFSSGLSSPPLFSCPLAGDGKSVAGAPSSSCWLASKATNFIHQC